MAMQLGQQIAGLRDELRYEPTAKRVRASLGGSAVLDTTRAILVWEPGWVVPQYAVPVEELRLELAPDDGAAEPDPDAPLYDPETGRRRHTADGQLMLLRRTEGDLPGVGFRLADPVLRDYVVLEWNAFDGWTEDGEDVIGHPHDPFARIDIRRVAQQVRVELDGHVLAESTRARALYETHLPVRYYLPREDVVVPLEPSETTSICAYKGQATYWSAELDGQRAPDVAWGYEQPLEESAVLLGLVCFFAERTDLFLDGVAQDRPQSPWS